MNTAWVYERRDTIFGEGEGLSGGNSINSSIKLGDYAGRLTNLNLARINNPSPNLTTVYLNTPLVGPTPEPLEYVLSPGRLGQPSGYPPSSTGTYISGARRRLPTPPLPYNMHPRMHPPTCQAQPCRVLQATGQEKISKILAPRGNPWQIFWSEERPNPSTNAYKHKGRGEGKRLGSKQSEQQAKKNSRFGNQGGTPGKILVAGVGKA